MTRADFIGGLVLSAFFGAALWEGWSFQYGTEFAPGPGFAPVWLSAIGLCVSLLIAAHGLLAMRSPERSAAAPELEKWGLVRVVLTLLGLGAMIFLVESLGLALSILLFLLYLTLVVQRHGAAVGIASSVGTVVFVYVVFVYFLEVPVPKGPLGF
ncbi:MAG TPA: tripartite tricarboxylate transporter TctB family protein [Burkholderiales bacterium]|nr:tripartite tricarboxylate transporter TctB family protein [Burkholderiales bacterium]